MSFHITTTLRNNESRAYVIECEEYHNKEIAHQLIELINSNAEDPLANDYAELLATMWLKQGAFDKEAYEKLNAKGKDLISGRLNITLTR